MEHLVSTKTDPASSTSEGVGVSNSRQKRRIYLFKSRLLHDNYSLFRNNFHPPAPLYFASSRSKKKKRKITSTKGRERNLVFGFLFFFTFIAARASYFTCFLFIYELPSVVLHFPSSLSIFLSTSKYHFSPPPTSLCSRKRVDVSRSHPSLSLSLSLLEMKLFRFHVGRRGASLSNVHSTGLCHFALNYPAEPQKFDQRTQFIRSEAECSDPVSRFSTSSDFFPFFSLLLSLFIQFIPPLTLPFIVARYHLPMFYLPAQFIPIYRHFVSRSTRERPFLKVG